MEKIKLQSAIKKLGRATSEEVFKTALLDFARGYAACMQINFDQDILPHITDPAWWKADYGMDMREGVAIGMDVKDAFKCLIDINRTFILAQGIRETVQFLKEKNEHSLSSIDSGTGTGILAILLTTYGVNKVYAIEYNPETFLVTKEFIKQCGLEKKIVLLEGDATKIHLDGVKNIDILVSENYSTALMDEPQFEMIIHLSKYLASDAEIIPYRAQLSVALGNTDWSQEEQIHTAFDMVPGSQQLSDPFIYATVVSKKDMEIPLLHSEISIPVKEMVPVNALIFRTDLQVNRVGKPYWLNSGDAEFVLRPWMFKVGDGNGIATETVKLHLHYQAGRRMTEMIVVGSGHYISLRDPFLENILHSKKISFVPKDLNIPQKYLFQNYVVIPISTKNVMEDWLALQANVETIIKLRGEGARDNWPNNCTLEENYRDLAWLELNAVYRQLFSYIIRKKSDGSYAGCLYIYPIQLFHPEKADQYDVDFSFWITEKEYKKGVYEDIFKDLLSWLENTWKFKRKRIFLRNRELPASLYLH